MKKQFNIKLADGTTTIIGCEEDALETILQYHFSGEQLESAIITEIPQVVEVQQKKITYKTMEAFVDEIENDNILKVRNYDNHLIGTYKGWMYEKIKDGILATPSGGWRDRTPIMITTVDELVHLDSIINGVQS